MLSLVNTGAKRNLIVCLENMQMPEVQYIGRSHELPRHFFFNRGLHSFTLTIKAYYTDMIIDSKLFTFHAGGSGSGGPSDLTWETGTLDGLRAFFDLVLIAAAMDSHHLTCALLHLIRY